MSKNVGGNVSVRAAVALALVAAQASNAQQVEADDPRNELGLTEVIVTATRREATVLEVPYNISAVSGESLENRNIIDNADLIRSLSGVTTIDRGHRNSGVKNSIVIRGLNVDAGTFGDYTVSAAPTVSTYVNETPIYANFLLKDIERVEVLRGPQGTLYGSGSLGGTLRYIMREPNPNEFSAQVQGSVSETDGSDDLSYQGDFTINVPLGETAAFRLNAAKLDYAGVVDYANVYVLDQDNLPIAPSGLLDENPANYEFHRVEDVDTVDIEYARASFRWEPSDTFRALLSYQLQRDEVGGRRQTTPGADGFGNPYRKYDNGAVQLEPSARDVDLAALEMTVDMGFASLTSSTSWYDHDGSSNTEQTPLYTLLNWLEDYYFNYPRPMNSAPRTYSDSAVVQELRLTSQGDNTLDYVVGLYYIDQDLDSVQQNILRGFKRWWDAAVAYQTANPSLPPRITPRSIARPDFNNGDVDFDYRRTENYREYAAFGELTWNITDAFAVTGGARYFDNKFENDTYLALPALDWNGPGVNPIFVTEADDMLFKLNASWKFADGYLAYATAAEGYRRGGANAVPIVNPFGNLPDYLTYDSDTATNYEIGVKGQAGVFQFSAAAFLVNWEDVQLNIETPVGSFIAAQNGEEARTQGIESEFTYAFSDRLNVTLGYTYVDAEVTEDTFIPGTPSDPDPILVAPDGAPLPGTAEHTVNLNLGFVQPLSSAMTWRSTVSGFYQSEMWNLVNPNSSNQSHLDAFDLWNLTTGLAFDRWDVTLFVRNLFNEEGVTARVGGARGPDPAENYYGSGLREFITQPRTIGVQLSVNF